MAALRKGGQVPIGSARWVLDERAQMNQIQDQEMEDYAFVVRNEVEWLNEHIAEIFERDQSVSELFKTPGKLRGKTPRTARRNGPEHRAPLAEILSTDLRFNGSPARSMLAASPTKQGTPSRIGMKKVHIDSTPKEIVPTTQPTDDVHDAMEIDEPTSALPEPRELQGAHDAEMGVDNPQEDAMVEHDAPQEIHAVSHAASESATSVASLARTSEPNHTSAITRPSSIIASPAKEQETMKPTPAAVQQAIAEHESLLEADAHTLNGSESSSEQSSPGKGLVRKSSLTFASLPAREPIPTKKSIGNLASRASNAEAPKTGGLNRNSYLDRLTGGKSMGAYHHINDDQMDVDDEAEVETKKGESDGDSKMAKLHNKSSTQRLHERINMLGKTQAPRPTKSIPAAAASNQPLYPELPKKSLEVMSKEQPHDAETRPAKSTAVDDDEEEWIKPLPKQMKPPPRPEMSKSRSVDVMEQIVGKTSISQSIQDGASLEQTSLQKGDDGLRSAATSKQAASIAPHSPTTKSPRFLHKKTVSVSNPSVPPAATTTPAGSPPSKHNLDGHISASKSKLQSIMKSARGLFSSSARVSSQAKLETLSPSSRTRQMQPTSLNEIVESAKNNMANERDPPPPVPAKEPVSTAVVDEPRRLRSSTEKQKISREQERNEEVHPEVAKQEHATKNSQKVPQVDSSTDSAGAKSVEIPQQPTRPTRQSPRRPQNPRVPSAAESNTSQSTAQSRSTATTAQSQKVKELRRPTKPAKETAPKQKPQPVSIRVGTLSQRVPLTNANLASSLQESLPSAPAPAPPTRPAGPVKKASNPMLHPSASTTSLNRSVSTTTAKPKALLAAERKKEQDEREAQRKLEHKKEIERKRAAAQEEARKRELQQRQEAEKQKEKERAAAAAADDARRQAQRAAIEKRRMELSKKEQQNDSHRAVNEMGQSLHREAPAVPSSSRPELGAGARRPSKLERPPISFAAANAARPKRVFDPDQDDELAAPIRAQPQGFQQNQAKRRRTSDEQNAQPPVRPTMAPPIRHSNIRKDALKNSIFGNNYPTAPPPAGMHAASQKAPVVNQGYQPTAYGHPMARPANPMEMANYTNGKIPFAEAPNPPVQGAYKTPLPTKQAPAMAAAHQRQHSSPIINNGENIYLSDIHTSDEDEDSEDERERKATMPDWVRTPNMDQLLRQQEAIDADAVFGPIAQPNLEEWFTKDQKRLHKLRARTSSANWFGGDRLTEDEVRRDNAAREQMSREGGWTFGLGRSG